MFLNFNFYVLDIEMNLIIFLFIESTWLLLVFLNCPILPGFSYSPSIDLALFHFPPLFHRT